MTKIKGDRALFEEYRMLAAKILSESSIVQNDMEVDDEEVDIFVARMLIHRKNLSRWTNKVVAHIQRCNAKAN